jgi:hypothetical protein
VPTVVHFEIPADNVQRARAFYEGLFGWKIEKFPGSDESPMDYWTISTTNAKGETGLCGGMMPRQAPEHMPVNYIDVPSLDEYVAKVEQGGGRVVMPRTAVPGMGYFAICLDTENNAFGLWEEDAKAA